MAEQIPLDLPSPIKQGRESYVVSGSNAMAFAMVENWADWPQGKLVLTGDAGSGKTHLAGVWAQNVTAQIVAAQKLAPDNLETLTQNPVVVEDIDSIAGSLDRETDLFHLHNMCLAGGQPLLMTARIPPNRLTFALPDLASRLGAATLSTLTPPDDALLSAILIKLFADRHISVKPRLLDYALARVDRNVAALQEFVREIERSAAQEGRKIGLRLARDVLDVTTGQAKP